MKTVITELSALRKLLKPIGFKVKLRSMSFGTFGTYQHMETGEELTFNVCGPETVARWAPFYELMSTIDVQVPGVKGLKVGQ